MDDIRKHIPLGKPENFAWADNAYPPATPAELAQIDKYMDYTEDHGFVFWRQQTPSVRCKPGKRVGTKHKNGYWVVRVKGRRISVSRIAWYFVHGEWPEGAISFIDRDPDNMRADNMIDNGKSAEPTLEMVAAYDAARQRMQEQDWTQVDGLREAHNQLDAQVGSWPHIKAALVKLGVQPVGDIDADARMLVALS